MLSKNSLLVNDFNIETLHEFLDSSTTEAELKLLKENEKQKVLKTDDGIIVKRTKEFEKHFKNIYTKKDRNFAIINAYYDGYSQVTIASYLKLSKSLISKVIKSGDLENCNGCIAK